ncbi:PAS domain S-box protein [Salegentibacter sp.]|uniref:PAS domain S-box protein n=1 Tax=Salegentibacter sp. TaxID=1903072 RepID=UPI0035681960
MKKSCEKIFKDLPLACLLLESKGDKFFVREVNEEYCKILGKNPSELLNLTIAEIFEKCDVQRETIQTSLTQTNLTRNIVVFQYEDYDSLKTTYKSYWEVINIPITEPGTDKTRYILHLPWNKTVEVLEERKRIDLQRELDTRRAEGECFIQKNRDGLFSLDPKGYFLNVNKGIVDMAEVSEEQLLSMSFLPFCAPEDRGTIFNYFEKALGGEDQNYEAHFISYKGRNLILEVSLVPMIINQKILGVYGIARDITEIKKAEKIIKKQQDQLTGTEKKFKALVQESSDLISILDLEGTYLFVSDSVTSILGIPQEEFIGKNAFDFIHPEDKEGVMASFMQVAEKSQVNIPSFRFRDSKGEWRSLETTITNFKDDPNIQGVVTNSRDITETRKLYIETMKRNKILKEIAWEHGHIVRAPLVRIMGLLDLIKEGHYMDWTKEEAIEIISDSVEELDQIISKTIRKTENV